MPLLIVIYRLYLCHTGSTLLLEYPKLTTWAFGGQFLLATHQFQIAHVTGDIPNVYRRHSVVCWALMLVNGYSFLTTGKPLIDELVMILIMNALIHGAIAHQVYYVLQDFKRVLGIQTIFTIRPRLKVEDTPSDKKTE